MSLSNSFLACHETGYNPFVTSTNITYGNRIPNNPFPFTVYDAELAVPSQLRECHTASTSFCGIMP